MKREELVRRQKDLMTHYIEKHQRGDEKGKSDVMQEYQRNNEQLKFTK